jgi:hypothetical protein
MNSNFLQRQRAYAYASPRIIQARFPNKCACGKKIEVGDSIFVDGANKEKARCLTCVRSSIQLSSNALIQLFLSHCANLPS